MLFIEIIFIFLLLRFNVSTNDEDLRNKVKFSNKKNIIHSQVTILEQKNKNDLFQDEKINYKKKESLLAIEENNKKSDESKNNIIFDDNSYIKKPNNKTNLESFLKLDNSSANIIQKSNNNDSKIDKNEKAKVTIKDITNSNMNDTNEKNSVNNKTIINNIDNLKVYKKIINPKNKFKLVNINDNYKNKISKVNNKVLKSDKASKNFSLAENTFCALISKTVFSNFNTDNLYFKKDKNNNINLDSTNISLNVSDNNRYLILPRIDAYKHGNSKTKFLKSSKDKVKVLIKNDEDLNSFSNYIVSESKKIKNEKYNHVNNEFKVFNRTKVVNILNKPKKKKVSNRFDFIYKFYLRIASMYHKSGSYDKEIEILSKGIKRLKDKNVDISLFFNKIKVAKELLKEQKEYKLHNKEKRKILQKKQ